MIETQKYHLTKKIAPKLRGYLSRDQPTTILRQRRLIFKEYERISKSVINTFSEILLIVYNIIIRFSQESENYKKKEAPVLQFVHIGVILILKNLTIEVSICQ